VNADKGLIALGDKLQHFEVAGEDRVFYPADAKIDGNTVLIWAKEVKAPVAARYAFSNDAIGNLFSREGIPASPFRTDNW
jgi:sialate O-acetylesterase